MPVNGSVSMGHSLSLVGGVRPDPAAVPPEAVELVGFPRDSDRSGFQRLYLTSTLDYSAESAAHRRAFATGGPVARGMGYQPRPI